ncbi:hypothetical protein AX774_g5805 [Zancudomyces culisetae]|uniref:Uncharacterized protein n=1 Tax=Zancudomyces culisetae TaxID=1213189 RepID=A0A1R1PIE7_ZANCU|nr:hypothetical protein AX774_g5805 [Zancudomyces culisetae]|eukprot:OMH80750.1 hypothetical protein AX774_g5805 [Zancudomyces culisetae]
MTLFGSPVFGWVDLVPHQLNLSRLAYSIGIVGEINICHGLWFVYNVSNILLLPVFGINLFATACLCQFSDNIPDYIVWRIGFDGTRTLHVIHSKPPDFTLCTAPSINCAALPYGSRSITSYCLLLSRCEYNTSITSPLCASTFPSGISLYAIFRFIDSTASSDKSFATIF